MQSPSELRSTYPAAEATAEAALPLIDQRAMSDWCDDMEKEDVLAILALVPDETAKCIADLKKAIAAKDVASARRTAHRLKGMAGNLGATRLSRMARAMELSSQSIEDVSGRMPTLEKTLTETLEVLRSSC
jgi:HPt (histidine-containing phosphotransfer) domain-containing protein